MTASIKNKLTRAEKNERTKTNLFDAAVKVVGEIGYRDASVTDITTRADIAQGTFYNYFGSKQDILDQLLPELGESLLEFLGTQVGESTFLDREEKSIRAYFQFIKDRPEFYRILTEAQVYSPQSFTRHTENLIRNYENSLKKTKENGFLADYSPDEFEAIAAILLGARVYLMSQFCFKKSKVRAIPEHVVDTFMKVITFGLRGSAATPGTNRKKATRQNLERTPELPQREIVHASDTELTVNYQTPAKLRGTSSAESDFFIQQLCSDVLKGLIDSLLAGDAHVQNTSVYISRHKMPQIISGSCRIEHTSAHEGIIHLRLTDTDIAAPTCLASGQASFCKT
jgi:AcrR family transcriptional regulator